MSAGEPLWVLQICHGYEGPFLDCARQYASLFVGTEYKVITVFLVGPPDPVVATSCLSEEVLFLGYDSQQVRGLKLGAIRAVREIARRHDFRFCITHRFKPLYVACLATRLPVIGVSHAFSVYQRFSRKLFAQLFRSRVRLLGVSQAVRDDLRRSFPDWAAERIEALYNRVDGQALRDSLLPRDVARRELGLPPQAWIIGNVGRLHPDKDQAALLRGFAAALPRLPEGSLLVIIGSGRLEKRLKALASELGIADRSRFIGQIPEARRFFLAFDAFVLTSDCEPFGMVLLEAMVAGVPVMCTDCGGGREVIEGAGILFPRGDEPALVDGLVRLARLDPEQLGACQQKMDARIDRLFSYPAARQRFWALPMLGELHDPDRKA